MEIKKIELEYSEKNYVSSEFIEGLCHIKTLDCLSIVQAVEGNYDITLGNSETQNTGDGGFFIAPSNVNQHIVHHLNKQTKNMTCRWVFIKVKINDVYDFDGLYAFPVILDAEQKNAMNDMFDRLFKAQNKFDEYACYYEIIKMLFSVSKEKTVKNPFNIDAVLNHIKNNYKQKITISELAKIATLSESHFFNVFKKATGVSPIAYINNYRMSVAVKLLLNSDMSICEISDSVGICDCAYFNKAFKKAYQMSPTDYKKLYKNSRD